MFFNQHLRCARCTSSSGAPLRYGHVRQRLDVPQVTLFATLRPFFTQKLPGIIDMQFLMSNTSDLYLVARHPILSALNPSSMRTSRYYCCAYVLHTHHRTTIFSLYPLSPLRPTPLLRRPVSSLSSLETLHWRRVFVTTSEPVVPGIPGPHGVLQP